MGNVPCGVPLFFDEEFQVFTAPPPEKTEDMHRQQKQQQSPGLTTESSTSVSEGSFLQVHKVDAPARCLLDPQEVKQAIVDQTEALIRRTLNILGEEPAIAGVAEEEEALSSRFTGEFSTALHSMASEASHALSSVVVAARTSSVVTTRSAATEVVGNHDRSQKHKKSGRRPLVASAPKIKGGKGFRRTEHMQIGIRRILMGHHYPLEQPSSSMSVALPDDHGCHLLSSWADETESSSSSDYAKMVLDFASVLHLKFVPHCVSYYQTHLSRLLPDNAVSRAATHSITSNNTINTANQKSKLRKSAPDLVLAMSDDSSSADYIEYGDGPPSTPILMLATDCPFMDLAVTGSLGLVDRRNKHHSSHVTPDRKQFKSPEHYIVLMNRRSGVPLAVCALRSRSTGPSVVRIFATKRRVYGQHSAATTRKLGLDWSSDSLPLFTWAEIVTEGTYPGRVRYSIFMATGSDGQFEESPSYCAVHESAGSPEIRVVGTTENEKYHAGCAVLSMCTNEDCTDEEDVFFRISVSRGIDPALFICFAAFVDETLEKNMRLQCQRFYENVYKTPLR
jgi:hypothetical protein